MQVFFFQLGFFQPCFGRAIPSAADRGSRSRCYVAGGAPSDPAAQGVVTANENGTWSIGIDIPGAVKANGLSDPIAGVVNFTCMSYSDAVIGGLQAGLEINSTDVDGKAAIVSSDTDGDGNYDHQHFDIDLIGFTPGETVTGHLAYANNEDFVRTLFQLQADANGRVTYTGDVPTDLPDGKYLIMITGSTYGEGLVSKPIELVNGWWNVQDEDIYLFRQPLHRYP